MTSFFGKVLRDPGSVAQKAGKQPWWQMTKTPRQGFFFAAVYLVIGLGQVVSGLSPSVRVLHLVIGGGLVALGIAYLAGTVALRRRVRSDDAARARGQPDPPPSS